MNQADPRRLFPRTGRVAALAATLLIAAGSMPPPASALVIDEVPPAVTNLVVTPATIVSSAPILVSATVTDETAVASAEVQVDGGPWQRMAPGDAEYGGATVSVSALLNVDVRQVSTNGPTTCVIVAGGSLLCWGRNSSGELGLGSTSPSLSTTAVLAAGLDGSSAAKQALRVGVGADFVCASLADASVRCWGAGTEGRLGNGGTAGSLTPVQVIGVTGGAGVDLTVGYNHACVIQGGGASVKCWGSGANGELGDGAGASSSTPVLVSGIDGTTAATTATQVAAGYYHTCARMGSGAVRCWGRNYEGQVGNLSAPIFTKTPVVVTGIDGSSAATSARSVAAGYELTCAVMASTAVATGGRVACWGSGAGVDALGRGGVPGDTRLPGDVYGLTGATPATAVVGVAVGGSHVCAFTVAGAALCWGSNAFGQLGTGNPPAFSNKPLAVAGLDGAIAAPTAASIDAGPNDGCVTDGNGRLWCWGWNVYGSLGDGTVTDRPTPVAQRGLMGPLADGMHTVCVRATDTSANTSGATCSNTVIDKTAPTATAPSATLRATAALSGTSVPVALAWSGADNAGGSGVARFELARSLSGGAWTTVAASLTSPSANVTVPSSGTVRFRARTVDAAGNVGAWAYGPTLTPRLTQQTSSAIRYSGTWTSTSSAAYSGGSAKYAKVAGRSATFTFTGRSIALVTTKASSRGKVKVYVNGAYVTTVNLYATTTMYRVLAWQKTWSTSGSRTVKLVVVGTSGRPRVDLDAFAVLR